MVYDLLEYNNNKNISALHPFEVDKVNKVSWEKSSWGSAICFRSVSKREQDHFVYISMSLEITFHHFRIMPSRIRYEYRQSWNAVLYNTTKLVQNPQSSYFVVMGSFMVEQNGRPTKSLPYWNFCPWVHPRLSECIIQSLQTGWGISLECRPPSSLSLSHPTSPHTICGPAQPCPARLSHVLSPALGLHALIHSIVRL